LRECSFLLIKKYSLDCYLDKFQEIQHVAKAVFWIRIQIRIWVDPYSIKGPDLDPESEIKLLFMQLFHDFHLILKNATIDKFAVL